MLFNTRDLRFSIAKVQNLATSYDVFKVVCSVLESYYIYIVEATPLLFPSVVRKSFSKLVSGLVAAVLVAGLFRKACSWWWVSLGYWSVP